jgi:hypothetical protein
VPYHQIPSEREIIHSFSSAAVSDLYSMFSEDHKDVKTQLSAGKIMISVFWGSQELLLVDYLPHITFNIQRYSNLLQSDMIRGGKKDLGNCQCRSMCLHDSACSHAENLMKVTLVQGLPG